MSTLFAPISFEVLATNRFVRLLKLLSPREITRTILYAILDCNMQPRCNNYAAYVAQLPEWPTKSPPSPIQWKVNPRCTVYPTNTT
jgi:hypothetical protein